MIFLFITYNCHIILVCTGRVARASDDVDVCDVANAGESLNKFGVC